jgi:heat shock protein HslJ
MLTLLLATGTVLGLAQGDPVSQLTANAWTLTAIDDEPVAADAGVTASFSADGVLSGSGGCNNYSATWSAEGSSLTITPIAATLILCIPDVDELETRYLGRLQAASEFAVSGGELTITTDDGGSLTYSGGAAGGIVGSWTLSAVDGNPVPATVEVTAIFDAAGTVSGSGGCNQYNGTYTLDGDSIQIGGLAATRMACEDDVMAIEDAYLSALEAAATWSVSDGSLTLADAGSQHTLEFTGESGGASFTSLTDAAWTLSQVDDVTVPADAGITANFLADGSINGSAGCNNFFGSYTVDGSTLEISGLASTRMACEQNVMDAEAAYLDALQAATDWSISGGQLTIISGDGTALVFDGIAVEGPTATPGATPGPGATGDGITGVTWSLSELAGTQISQFATVTIEFGPDGTLTGNAGCNDYQATYLLDEQTMAIRNLEVGGEQCDDLVMSFEQAYLQLLPLVDEASIAGDQLTLTISIAAQDLVFTSS